MNVAFAAVDVPALALAQMSPHWCSCTRVEPAQSPSITFRHKEPPPSVCVPIHNGLKSACLHGDKGGK